MAAHQRFRRVRSPHRDRPDSAGLQPDASHPRDWLLPFHGQPTAFVPRCPLLRRQRPQIRLLDPRAAELGTPHRACKIAARALGPLAGGSCQHILRICAQGHAPSGICAQCLHTPSRRGGHSAGFTPLSSPTSSCRLTTIHPASPPRHHNPHIQPTQTQLRGMDPSMRTQASSPSAAQSELATPAVRSTDGPLRL